MLDQKKTRTITYSPVAHHLATLVVESCFLISSLLLHGCSSRTGMGNKIEESAREPTEPTSIMGTPVIGHTGSSGTASLVCDKTVHDLGRVKSGKMARAVFRLTNEGTGTLRITDIRRCCGAVVKLDKKELPPGEEAVLTAEYRVLQASSTVSKKIGIVTNDPANSVVELTVTGQVVQTLVWTPARFKIAAYERDVVCPEITIRSLDNTPFSIKGLAATGQCLTADFDADQRATEFTLRPHVDAAKLAALSTTSGTIRIDLDHPDYKVATVIFDVTPAFQATPTQLIVFNAKAGESILRDLKVQDNRADSDTVEVESVTAKNGTRVELREVTPGKTGCELRLELWPGGGAENQSFSTDELIVKMKDGREVIVPLRVFYKR